MLFYWTRHVWKHGDLMLSELYSYIVPLSTHLHQWLLANSMLGITLQWTSKFPFQGEAEILLSSGLMGHLYEDNLTGQGT